MKFEWCVHLIPIHYILEVTNIYKWLGAEDWPEMLHLIVVYHHTQWNRCLFFTTLWRHQMETFSALLALCAGNSPAPGEIPAQRPVTRNFDVLLDLRLNKRLSKQPWGWWFVTPSWALWRQCNEKYDDIYFLRNLIKSANYWNLEE